MLKTLLHLTLCFSSWKFSNALTLNLNKKMNLYDVFLTLYFFSSSFVPPL